MAEERLYSPAFLTDNEVLAMHKDDIEPTVTGARNNVRRVLFSAGPTGSGKSTVLPVFARQIGLDGAFLLDGDALLENFHPRYVELNQRADVNGTSEVSEVIQDQWWRWTAEAVRRKGID